MQPIEDVGRPAHLVLLVAVVVGLLQGALHEPAKPGRCCFQLLDYRLELVDTQRGSGANDDAERCVSYANSGLATNSLKDTIGEAGEVLSPLRFHHVFDVEELACGHRDPLSRCGPCKPGQRPAAIRVLAHCRGNRGVDGRYQEASWRSVPSDQPLID